MCVLCVLQNLSSLLFQSIHSFPSPWIWPFIALYAIELTTDFVRQVEFILAERDLLIEQLLAGLVTGFFLRW